MRRAPEPWKPPAWLEPAFIYMAFTVAAVAAVALFLWVLVTFFAPFFQYSRETRNIPLKYGQVLRVEYPNTVVSSETPNFITLVISGKSIVAIPSTFIVEIPPGLTVVEPAEQARAKTLILSAPNPGSPVESTQIQIGVVNSRTEGGFFPTVSQPVIITSSVMPGAETIRIGIETIPWIALRSIVNNTINERSTLILLVTGFLSGAGTLVLQYMKTHRDRQREDRQKKEKEFRELLDKNILETLNRFVGLDRDPREDSDFSIYKGLVDSCDWENELQRIILENLNRDVFKAKRAANVLEKLINGQRDKYSYLVALCALCNLASTDDRKNHQLKDGDAEHLETAYIRWPELKPVVTALVNELTELRENLPIIDKKLAPVKNGQLLRDANIQRIIDKHLVNLAIGKRSHKAPLRAAESINKLLISDIQWRGIWSGNERKPSDKIQRWLAWCWFESGNVEDNISLGSELAELDNKLMSLLFDHPIFKQIDGSFPTIVFGDVGMGKTASALWLVDKYQKAAKADNRESKVFPVYAPFEPGVDVKEWLVEKVSRALIEFTADNPRRFLTAPESQKTAMSRLMLRHAQTADALRIDYYRSPFDSAASDIEQVLDYITKFKHKKTTSRLTKEEMLNLLYMAKPDIFEQIHFLWDIRSAASQEEVTRKIREMDGLTTQLARQNVIIKIFAPLTAKGALGRLAGFHSTDHVLTWTQSQLRELIEKRIRMLDALGERGFDDLTGFVITSAEQSPRGVIRFLIRLMDYVDENLGEGEKLKRDHFGQVRP